MQDLNAAIQAAKSAGDTPPVLLGGPVYTRSPSEFWLKTPQEIPSVALKAFLNIAFLTLARLSDPISLRSHLPPTQEKLAAVPRWKSSWASLAS